MTRTRLGSVVRECRDSIATFPADIYHTEYIVTGVVHYPKFIRVRQLRRLSARARLIGSWIVLRS